MSHGASNLSLRQRISDRELKPLQKLFPSVKEQDFQQLANGNYCVQISFITTGKYACGYFDVLIEYPYNYPINASCNNILISYNR